MELRIVRIVIHIDLLRARSWLDRHIPVKIQSVLPEKVLESNVRFVVAKNECLLFIILIFKLKQ